METWEITTAAFIDEHDTVVGCFVTPMGEDGVGREEDGTLMEYQLRGAGVVLDDGGRILTEATTLQIGVAGDSVMTSHPVANGIAIVDAWVVPKAAVHFDWDKPPPVEGRVYGPDGTVLATCRG